MKTKTGFMWFAWGLLVTGAALAQDGIFADFFTTQGNFTVELNYQKAPRTVANFIGLATGDRAWRDPETGGIRKDPFYNGSAVHQIPYTETERIGFYSGLRPTRNVDGSSAKPQGPGYTILDETTNGLSHSNGVIAMVQSGPHLGASEFVVTRTNAANYFNGINTVFGRVISGMPTVETISSISMSNGVPLESIVISNVVIRRVGTAAQAFNMAAWSLPKVVTSAMSLHMASGTNSSFVAYNVPPKSEYFVAHTTNLLDPARAVSSVGFNSTAQSLRMTNEVATTFEKRFFHAVQSEYPVFSAIELKDGIRFAASFADGTHYLAELNLQSRTGAWGFFWGEQLLDTGGIFDMDYGTVGANTTRIRLFEDSFFISDFTFGFEKEGDTVGRYRCDWTYWGDPNYYDFAIGSCEYAPWTP